MKEPDAPLSIPVTISLKDFTINADQIGNLADEFIGKVVDNSDGALTLIFGDRAHIDGFANALQCFVQSKT